MQLTVVYNLLIFVGCLVLPMQCQTICKKDQYTVVASDGSFVRCLNCGTCHPGRGLYPPCGRHIPDPPDVECKDCPPGTFSAELDSAPCHSCQHCAEHEIIAAPCTNRSNRICNGTCVKGYFYSKKDSTHNCQKCAYCCFDGKDEEMSECVNQGLNVSKQHCRPRPDKDCSPVPSATSPTGLASGTKTSKGGGLSKTTIIVIGVIGAVVVGAAAVTVAVCMYRRKKKRESSTAAQSYARNGPGTEPTVEYHNSSYTPSNTVTPAGSRDGLQTETRIGAKKVAALNEKAASEQAVQNPSSLPDENKPPVPDHTAVTASMPIPVNEAADNLGSVKRNFSGGILPHFSRQGSKESQKSGDGTETGSGKWKRSPSTSSFTEFTESLKKKMSTKRDEILVHNEEEDPDRAQGPITIIGEPSPQQEAKEGTKVELVFKCQARSNSKLFYQWLKDDTELQGKNESILLLKSVTLPDFGSYKCRVSCNDSPSHVVESSHAELDVTPRDGTRYRYLYEIEDPTIQDRVGILLSQKTHGLGWWRQVAFKYGMDQLNIRSLQDDPEAGSKTLEYLNSHNTYLTVYDFCKTLKKCDIGRLDIVRELIGHLSAPCSTTAYV